MVGIIKYILDRPAQPLFVIEKGDTELFVPAIDEFIDQIDRQAKKIYLNCPEGLFDVYAS